MSYIVTHVNRHRPGDGKILETVKLTPIMLDTISRYNSNMTPVKCSQALSRGERVYTAFSYYTKADPKW